jgi:hypothetical protein
MGNHLTILQLVYVLLYIDAGITALILLPLKINCFLQRPLYFIYSVKFNSFFGYEKIVHPAKPSFYY